MKITGVILSLLVLLLNGIPCCTDDCDEASVGQEQTESTHPGEVCSPFLSCGSCTGFVPFGDLPVIDEESTDPKKELPQKTQGSYSEFISLIWQPPKK